MKTFHQFQEDIEQLRRGLETLERQSAPKERLSARRRAALERTRQIHKSEKRKQQKYREQQAELRRQREQNEELQLEQDPHMTPTPFNVMKSKAQAKGGIEHRKHVHQEIGAEARAQQSAKRARMRAILSR